MTDGKIVQGARESTLPVGNVRGASEELEDVVYYNNTTQ
jgi:hypothetical protein